ncbi:ABC transporter ATP-binding protein/permease [Enterovirga rhinocerotis]|uniref:Putative ATP-binding cassette transporter n=1 Tax=Enterovirga rhinocerotis TaxID=1339210 RepID=A0A4R7CBP1_9HYPH|nr:ABC transporter ATP-binding protein/permease [Enterovirga rhinocerotis]TDR94516.1 putative ATP-binding cassette transporter [Enterovirga rhinocerotis]
MTALSLVIGAFSLATLFFGVARGGSFGDVLLGGPLPAYVPLTGAVLAAIVFLSRSISPYLRIFVTMYALGFLFLATLSLLGGLGFLPQMVTELLPPAFSASAAAVFALIVYGVSFIPVIRTITTLADPYFRAETPSSDFGRPFAWLGSREGRVGARLVGLLIGINFFQVAMNIRFNSFYRDLFNALQEKNVDAFWHQILGVFAPLAAIWIAVAVYEIFVDNALLIRWRSWLTQRTTRRWLENGTHYRIPLLGHETDNPDQRIQADIRLFIDQLMSLSIRLLSQAATLVSFVIILWHLSRDFVLPGTEITMPGFLVWLVIVYAVVGTWLTHLIGRPLIGLDFRQEKVEADFRFSLARLREYGEQVALLRGEKAETARLERSFTEVARNFLQILSRRMKLTSFTAGYNQLSVIFPYVLAAPSYFMGRITLGVFQQTANAFSQVQSAMSFFISAYVTLAAFKANVDRLTTFNDSMAEAEAAGLASGIDVAPQRGGHALALQGMRLALPDGREIVDVKDFAFEEGRSVLITGPSGSGKSTMFRAIAGIWPFGRGHVEIPVGKRVMLIPQKPYIPVGTLRAAVTYPGLDEHYDDEAIRKALLAVNLGQFVDKLDIEDYWGQRLSGGEQQRLSLARALLAKPDWLLLDEATASLDEPMEAAVYDILKRELPDTTVVSIGHRSTLIGMHDRQVVMTKEPDGLYDLRDKNAAAPA